MEADAAHAARDARDRPLPPGHPREGFGREVHVGADLRHDVAGAGSADRDDRPLLGHARAGDPQFGPFGLEPLLEPIQDGRRAARGRRHEVAIVGEPHRDAVVEHHPVEPQHERVPDRADGEVRHPVRVHPVQEDAGVGPGDLDLAERRRVQGACSVPDGQTLAFDRGVETFAVLREVPRAQPLPDVLEDGAALHVGRVDRGGSLRIQQRRAAVHPREHRERHRHVRRARAARSLRAQLPAERGVHDLGREHPARASLVDRRADVGRALHVLDAPQAPFHGIQDVLHGLVTLQVDEVRREVVGRCVPVRGARGETEARGRSDDLQPVGSRAVGHVGRERLVVAKPTADRARQLCRGVPAA